MKTPKGRTPRILELHDQGYRQCEIVRMVPCDSSQVYATLKRWGKTLPDVKAMRIAPISREDMAWLRAEAQATKVRWQDLARAMLTDAIQEARDGRD